jgi:endoglucanase
MYFSINKGTNISHWLSQHLKGDNFKKRFSEKDCNFLADFGFDHIRIPFEEQVLWGKSGILNKEALAMLHRGVEWALNSNLNVVLDLHSTYSHHFCMEDKNTLFSDPEAQKRFGQIWSFISDEFRYLPADKVAYELLNEPVAKNHSDWNTVLQIPYHILREKEPDRVIAIGSNRWCQAVTFPFFTPPENDKNIILVFHYYNPMALTHYKASWIKYLKDYSGPVNYPGIPYSADELNKMPVDMREYMESENDYFASEVMKKQLMPVLEKGVEMNLKLWCNEFGVISSAPKTLAQQWYKDLFTLFADYNIAWTNWDFKGGFGIIDADNNLTINGKNLKQWC